MGCAALCTVTVGELVSRSARAALESVAGRGRRTFRPGGLGAVAPRAPRCAPPLSVELTKIPERDRDAVVRESQMPALRFPIPSSPCLSWWWSPMRGSRGRWPRRVGDGHVRTAVALPVLSVSASRLCVLHPAGSEYTLEETNGVSLSDFRSGLGVAAEVTDSEFSLLRSFSAKPLVCAGAERTGVTVIGSAPEDLAVCWTRLTRRQS